MRKPVKPLFGKKGSAKPSAREEAREAPAVERAEQKAGARFLKSKKGG